MKTSAPPQGFEAGGAFSVSDREGGRWPAWRAGRAEKKWPDGRNDFPADGGNGRQPDGSCFKGRDDTGTGGRANRAGRPRDDAMIVTGMEGTVAALLRDHLATDRLCKVTFQRGGGRNAQGWQEGEENGKQPRRHQSARDAAPLLPYCVNPSPAHATFKKARPRPVEVAKGRIALHPILRAVLRRPSHRAECPPRC